VAVEREKCSADEVLPWFSRTQTAFPICSAQANRATKRLVVEPCTPELRTLLDYFKTFFPFVNKCLKNVLKNSDTGMFNKIIK
jgi:hypothetical protein